MSFTSVSLESLHFLLQHMDANKRFEISNRCPSLREFEKTVPLKINSLVLMNDYVIVNDTTYKLGIIRECKVGEAPRYIAASNERGGYPYEVDGYGIIDESEAFTVTPGDIATNRREEQFIEDEELHIEHLEEEIQIFEEELTNLRGRRPSRRNLESIDLMEKMIEDARAQMFDYECRRDNIPSKYEFFLQFTKSRTVDKQEQKTSERYKHNKKFSEAMKQMSTTLFGGRSSPIFVRKFEIFLFDVIRLPVALKLQIEHLVFCAVLETKVGVLDPILDDSSFPLRKLEIAGWSDEDATNPMVKTAGILRIRDIFPQAISSITNPVVRISMAIPEENIEALVGSWIESQRPVGYKYIFGFDCEPHCPDEIEDMLKELNGVITDDESAVIPMTDATQLTVSYGPFPKFAPRSKWAIKFLTEAIEH